ncbi:MAG: acyltransferase [Prevotella sp.]|nr:acyltransferase [Prevotella sp.]
MKQNNGFDALKVLMILFVIFIHENPTLESHGNVVMWWHSIVVCAVPVFFVLSGYFFFNKVECFDVDVYKRKIKTRIKTLLVPYLIWNCVPVLFVALGNLYSIMFRNKSTDDLCYFMRGLWNDGLWHIWWDKTNGMPFDSPLWYVRDLIILCVFSPVIYWILKRMNYWWIGLLSLLFIVGVTFPIGFSITGLLFFSIGAVFAINRLEWQKAFGGGKYLTIIVLSLCALSNIYKMDILHQLFLIGVTLMMVLLFSVAKGKVVGIIANYSESVFFVLAIHNIIVLAQTGKFLTRILPEDSIWIVYWIAPFVTLAICVVAYYLMKRITPCLMKILCGGR